MSTHLHWLDQPQTRHRAVADIGGKAAALARLVEAQLPVPPGFVIDTRWDDSQSTAELLEGGAALGSPLVVRSSSPAEDRVQGSAAGLFDSYINVSLETLRETVAAVRRSGQTDAVRHYLAAQSPGLGVPSMAVIVQSMVGGPDALAGTTYTRPPEKLGDESMLWIEVRHRQQLFQARVSRNKLTSIEQDPEFPLTPAMVAKLCRLCLEAERTIDGDRGADVEWIFDHQDPDKIWLVQARPLVNLEVRQLANSLAPSALAFSREQPEVRWAWDCSHNPDPLSPAQQGLVALVADHAPYDMRIVDGYLYAAARKIANPAATGALDEIFAASTERMEQLLAAAELDTPVDLEVALHTYREVYRQYAGVLGPALATERGKAAGPGKSAIARMLVTAGSRGLDSLAGAWDVAAPAISEDLLERATRRLPVRTRSPASATAKDMLEEDDVYFFRAQALVRTALLAAAARWSLSNPEDIFFLPLAEVRRQLSDHGPVRLKNSEQQAGKNRRLRDLQRTRIPPFAIQNGRAERHAMPNSNQDHWRGRSASAGTARGSALVIDDLCQSIVDPMARIVVAPSVTPASLVQMAGAAGIVCQFGGALDHMAAIARELGIPAVVGVSEITRRIQNGDELMIDGTTGLVVRLAKTSGFS